MKPYSKLRDSEYDDAYHYWQQRVHTLSTVNTWLSLFFLCVHPLIMCVGYDFWAEKHWLMLAHSFQQMLLGLYCWALPDQRFEHWLKMRVWVFYLLAGVNLLLAGLVFSAGTYFYINGPALYSFISASLATYVVLASGPLILTIIVSFELIQVKFNGRPEADFGDGGETNDEDQNALSKLKTKVKIIRI
ncbi:hypothetical protein FGO68_gene6311 [Halteria grandinella]|uniref:Transmembrane protein n=1 Tax=Halteria grandinella TaxID=5974 RepID=A0A8J8NLG9_HALGN|nr:hypothetical protein FGO68_gene6311 [Halteria grandinella]